MFCGKNLLLLCCVISMVWALPRSINVGTPYRLSGKELAQAVNLLENTLRKVANAKGPHYSVSSVKSTTRQTVAGTVHKYDAVLKLGNGNSKSCKIWLWTQPWVRRDTKVSIDCVGEKKFATAVL